MSVVLYCVVFVRACHTCPAELHLCIHHCRVQPYAMEISEGNFIYQTYGIRMMPFFLVFRSGRLVDATNDVSTKASKTETGDDRLIGCPRR